MSRLVIGTRGSRLALAQARAVAGALGAEEGEIELKIIQTRGDRLREMRFSEQLDKGFFTTELERALSDGEVDLVVHSLKDLPTASPEGLIIAAVPGRAPVGDVLLVRPESLVAGDSSGPLPLAPGARVGTSAARRRALLAHLSPGHVAVDFRGNVPTRVEKCLRGDVDAIILARAGLSRLGLDASPLRVFDLDPEVWNPAPGQGALAIQSRAEDSQLHARLSSLHHPASHRAVVLERQVLATLEGGCHAACGAVLLPNGEGMSLHMGMVLDAARGWQRRALRLPLHARPTDLDAERAQVVRAVETMRGEPGAGAEPVGWWAQAEPWRLS